MQIVIEIDEKLYNYIKTEEYDKHLDKRFDYQIRFAVKDGIPLPKGHGKLKDVSNILTVTEIRSDGSEYTFVPYSEIEDAPTIIEADKVEE